MPLTVHSLEEDGLLDELATVFSQEPEAIALLERIGFARNLIPNFAAAGNSLNFWRAACIAIQNGRTPGGLDRLIRAAADAYPYNPHFTPWRQEEAKPGNRTDSGSSILVMGGFDVHALIDRTRAIAQARGLGRVELGIVTDQTCQIRLPEAGPEQAYDVAQELQRGGEAARTSVVPNEFRDYLLGSLRVEGPDTSRFELNSVPASTRVREIARATMTQYAESAESIWPQDRSGHARPAVVDQIDPESGASRRLEPDATLHDSRIPDGATLHVAPESTAGINPRIRDEALARVRAQVLAYADSHPGFEVQANSKQAPTEYLFRFKAPGWGPPAAPDPDPYPVDRHEVFLVMPPDFPMVAPTAFWQSPIYHPNVHPGNGKVCLGALEDLYRPAMDFRDICQLLVDIATYQNYEITEGYDEAARNWAVSERGQAAIESRGGRSVTRMLLVRFREDHGEPPLLRIRRREQ